jgi:type VI protein secretion system component VasK
MRSLVRILYRSFAFLLRLVAAAVLISTAAKSIERGGLWYYALAALCILLAAFAVLMAGLYVWVAWRHLRGKPIDLE